MNHKWAYKKLSSVCDRIGDGLHGTPEYDEQGEFYFVNGNNLEDGFIKFFRDTKKVGVNEFNSHNVELSDKTLLLSINGTIGSLALYRGEPIVLGKSAAYINCRDIDRRFVYYYFQLRGVVKAFYNIATGSTIKNLGLGSLQEFLIPVPPREVQAQIVDILSLIDSKIQTNNQINTELEASTKLLYDYWFVQFDFPTTKAQATQSKSPAAEGRPYRSTGGELAFSESLKREIPVGWTAASFSTLTNNFDAKRVPLSKSERSKRKGKYPYYGATEMMDQVDDYLFDGDYILVAEDGSVMDANGFPVLQFIFGKSWVNNHAHVVQAKNEEHNEFVYFSLKRTPVVNIMSGSVQKKITQENLNNTPILLPCEETLEAFCAIANANRKQRVIIQKQNDELIKLRNWLLPMLMNGQVSVR